MTPAEQPQAPTRFGLLVRVGIFLLVVRVAFWLLGGALHWVGGLLLAGTVASFLAGLLANSVAMRVYERASVAAAGLGWSPASPRHLLEGTGAGLLAGALAVGGLLAAGGRLVPASDPAAYFAPGKLAFVSVLLLFGAAGEELMFRGYGFQLLLALWGSWAIAPISILFAALHAWNPGSGVLSLVNTALWGFVLGYAVYRTGDLWLATGIHFGWNLALPIAGANLSGFTIGLSGRQLEVSQLPALWSGGAYGPEASLFTTAVAAVAALFIHFRGYRLQPALLLARYGRRGAAAAAGGAGEGPAAQAH
jgi:membrane protease YdiL (CAAX protease family)